MAGTEYNDALHYALFKGAGAIRNGNSFEVRWSEITLAALRSAGFLDNMIDGTVPPTIDKLWLDKNSDPAVLKEWNPVGSNWEKVTSATLFGRVPWRGAWQTSPVYRTGDVVSFNNEVWIAVQPSQNQPPAENAYWDLFLSSLGMQTAVYDPQGRNEDIFALLDGDKIQRSANGATLIFEGDSLTYGLTLPSPSTQNFGYLLSQMEWAQDKKAYFNFGTGGATIQTTMPGRYVASVKPHRPTPNGGDGGPKSYLFLMAGINDLQASRTAAQIVSDITTYVATAKADGFTVIVGTLPPNSFASPVYPYETARQDVNGSIRSNTIGADVIYDTEEVLANPFSLGVFPDGVHVSTVGNRLWAEYLNQGLRAGGFSIKTSAAATTAMIASVLNAERFVASCNLAPATGSRVSGWDTPSINVQSSFDPVAGIFTAKRIGFLHVHFQCVGLDPAAQLNVRFRKNGAGIGPEAYIAERFENLRLTAMIPLAFGDTVDVVPVTGTFLADRKFTWISGHMMY